MSKKGYEIGGWNVFKDIGVPNAEEYLLKAQLVFKIDTIMKKRGMKQRRAAELFGVPQPGITKVLHSEFRQFSVERLLRFLVKLDQDVQIVVGPHRDRHDACGTARVAKHSVRQGVAHLGSPCRC
jgi:predicted XRE-type DNA-binding protein